MGRFEAFLVASVVLIAASSTAIQAQSPHASIWQDQTEISRTPAAISSQQSELQTAFGETTSAKPVTNPLASSPDKKSGRTDPLALPLKRPERFSRSSSPEETSDKKLDSTATQFGTTIVMLAGVIGLILFLSRVFKKHSPLTGHSLPNEVLEVLGRKMLDRQHAVHYLRIGNRILVVGISADGMNTLAEITDPVEIDRISGQCRTIQQETAVGKSFKMLLAKTTRESTPAQTRTARSVRADEDDNRQPVPDFASWTQQPRPEPRPITQEDIDDLGRTLAEAQERRA